MSLALSCHGIWHEMLVVLATSDIGHVRRDHVGYRRFNSRDAMKCRSVGAINNADSSDQAAQRIA